MNMKKVLRKSAPIFIVVMLIGGALYSVQAQAVQLKLPSRVEDGVMLHAYMWNFKAIQENLKNISEAGYNAIQVSPVQQTKQSEGEWWLLYQPCNLKIGNAQLGTHDEFKTLCETAENSYGIKIIVDAVLNQVADNDTDGQWADQLDPSLKQDKYYHNKGTISDYRDRRQLTQNNLGNGPDWNTQRRDVQDMHLAFLNSCIDSGADGFRFDAAKHIETNLGEDCDKSWSGNYWHRVLNGIHNRDRLYLFGEVILDEGDNRHIYINYFDITAHNHGRDLVYAVSAKNIADTLRGCIGKLKNVPINKALAYVENHDNFERNDTRQLEYRDRKLAHAIIVARAGLTPRLYDRPTEDMWNDPDVVAVNWFRNNMVGEDEYLRFPSNEVVAIERGHRGIVIVNAGGHKDIEFGTRLRQGTYENRATADCSLTVSNGQLNGQIPDKSIIVLYKDESQPAQESTKTIFKAHYDVGMDNFLSLRGNVQPLSWHKGIAMDWTEGNVWVFETEELPVSADIEFKVLFNDRDWEKGMNHRVRGGEATDFTPRF